MLPAVVETIYPGAAADWSAYRRGTFAVEAFDATIGRQTGMYRALAGLPREKQLEVVASICGKCVRHPTWFYGSSPAMPCGEPCNVWLTAALEAK